MLKKNTDGNIFFAAILDGFGFYEFLCRTFSEKGFSVDTLCHTEAGTLVGVWLEASLVPNIGDSKRDQWFFDASLLSPKPSKFLGKKKQEKKIYSWRPFAVFQNTRAKLSNGFVSSPFRQ